MGIGVRNQQNIMVVAATNVNMREFGYVFKALGAPGLALNLDVEWVYCYDIQWSLCLGPGPRSPMLCGVCEEIIIFL